LDPFNVVLIVQSFQRGTPLRPHWNSRKVLYFRSPSALAAVSHLVVSIPTLSRWVCKL